MNGRRQSLTAAAQEARRVEIKQFLDTFPEQVEKARREREYYTKALRDRAAGCL